MTKTSPSLCIAVLEKTAFIKVPGRANFASSMDLKTVVNELRDRGIGEFILDLHDCVTMDSTFLGVLAGLVLRGGVQPGAEARNIELLNPNPRVLELVENLGVLDYFRVKREEVPSTLIFEATENLPERSKEETTRNCLEAHQTLMNINPANIPKFKEVTQFMAEDLKKMSDNRKTDGEDKNGSK